MKITALLVLAVIALAAGAPPPAWGSAQLGAYLVPNDAESYFSVYYIKSVAIESGKGGQLEDLLSKSMGATVKVSAQHGDPDVEALRAALNENIRLSGSRASIHSLDVQYKAILVGSDHYARMVYEATVSGTLGGYTLREATDKRPAVVDVAWMDFTVREPVTVQGTEINLLRGAFEELAPEALASLPEEAAARLESPLFEAAGIHEAPFGTWREGHSLVFDSSFDRQPVRSEQGGFLVESSYWLGSDCPWSGWFEVGKPTSFKLDRPYVIRTYDSSTCAHVTIWGYATIERYHRGDEVVRVWPTAPEWFGAEYYTVGLQDIVIFGIAGIGAGGGAAVFLFSRRALKREGQTAQQGTGAFPAAGLQVGAGSSAQRRSGYGEPPSPAPTEDAASPGRVMSPAAVPSSARIRRLGNLRLAMGVAIGISGVMAVVALFLQNTLVVGLVTTLTFALFAAQLFVGRVERRDLVKRIGAEVEKGIAAGIERVVKAAAERKGSLTATSPSASIRRLGNLGLAVWAATGIAVVVAVAGIASRNPEIFGFGIIPAIVLPVAKLFVSRVERGDLVKRIGAEVEKGIAAGIERGLNAAAERKGSLTTTPPSASIRRLGNLELAVWAATGIAVVVAAVGILLQELGIFGLGLILTFALLVAQLFINRIEQGAIMKQAREDIEKGIAAGIEQKIRVVIEQRMKDEDPNPDVTDLWGRPAGRPGNMSRAPVRRRNP